MKCLSIISATIMVSIVCWYLMLTIGAIIWTVIEKIEGVIDE